MFALCALDMAYSICMHVKKGKKLYELWSIRPIKPINRLHYRINFIEKMLSKMMELPWPIYKIKLGTHEDIDIVRD
jgi:hypothetical protein